MAENASEGGLQIREERGFQEKLWTAQRIGWVLMLLFVIAALLGATGSGGPLSMARAQSGQATVNYPRIARWQASTQMIVTLAPSASGQADLYLPQSLLDVFAVEGILPEPAQARTAAGGQLLTFDVGQPGASRQIVVRIRASRPAFPTAARMRIGDSPPLDLNFTVLP